MGALSFAVLAAAAWAWTRAQAKPGVTAATAAHDTIPEIEIADIVPIFGKVLRLKDDGTVPADNPFVGTSGARGEIWAYGLRNPWKMSFDPLRGDLWVGDVGWEMFEMVYRIRIFAWFSPARRMFLYTNVGLSAVESFCKLRV